MSDGTATATIATVTASDTARGAMVQLRATQPHLGAHGTQHVAARCHANRTAPQRGTTRVAPALAKLCVPDALRVRCAVTLGLPHVHILHEQRRGAGRVSDARVATTTTASSWRAGTTSDGDDSAARRWHSSNGPGATVAIHDAGCRATATTCGDTMNRDAHHGKCEA